MLNFLRRQLFDPSLSFKCTELKKIWKAYWKSNSLRLSRTVSSWLNRSLCGRQRRIHLIPTLRWWLPRLCMPVQCGQGHWIDWTDACQCKNVHPLNNSRKEVTQFCNFSKVRNSLVKGCVTGWEFGYLGLPSSNPSFKKAVPDSKSFVQLHILR